MQCDEIYKYECKSRTEFTQIINLKLNNLELVDPESFKYEIKAINIEQSTLDNILEIEPLLEILSQPTDQLRYLIRLFSYKPISLAFDIIVHRENGGQWKFPFNINITQSDPDDILVIYSNLNQLSSLSFNLTNTISEDSPFEAYFTTESPSNFNVYPNSGLLTQIGSKGVDFVVSFKPSQYGKEYIGVLVINTTDMQWIYEIHGRHPDYERPEGSTKLITKLSPNLQNRLKMAKVTTTNHVTSNIQKIKKNVRN